MVGDFVELEILDDGLSHAPCVTSPYDENQHLKHGSAVSHQHLRVAGLREQDDGVHCPYKTQQPSGKYDAAVDTGLIQPYLGAQPTPETQIVETALQHCRKALKSAKEELAICEAAKAALQQSLDEVKAQLGEYETSRTFLEASVVEYQTKFEVAMAQLQGQDKQGEGSISDRVLEGGDVDVDVEEMSESSQAQRGSLSLAMRVEEQAFEILGSPRALQSRVDGQFPEHSLEEQVLDLRAELERSRAYEAELRQELAERRQHVVSADAKLTRYAAVAKTRLKKVESLQKLLAEERQKCAALQEQLDTAKLSAEKRNGPIASHDTDHPVDKCSEVGSSHPERVALEHQEVKRLLEEERTGQQSLLLRENGLVRANLGDGKDARLISAGNAFTACGEKVKIQHDGQQFPIASEECDLPMQPTTPTSLNTATGKGVENVTGTSSPSNSPKRLHVARMIGKITQKVKTALRSPSGSGTSSLEVARARLFPETEQGKLCAREADVSRGRESRCAACTSHSVVIPT